MPKPYDPDFKDRALRMLAEALPEHASLHAASKHIGGLLGVSPDTLRVWQGSDVGLIESMTCPTVWLPAL